MHCMEHAGRGGARGPYFSQRHAARLNRPCFGGPGRTQESESFELARDDPCLDGDTASELCADEAGISAVFAAKPA